MRGLKKYIELDRRIFVLTFIRGILDRLLYIDLYPEAVDNMSNSNIGWTCHKIHVGSSNFVCPRLHVHGTIMKQVNEDSYLGDLISDFL